MNYTWLDDYGYHWEWNGSRIFCIEAEKEEPISNGYPAYTEEEAIEVLIDGGYITNDTT